MNVLTLNAGSRSHRPKLYDPVPERPPLDPLDPAEPRGQAEIEAGSETFADLLERYDWSNRQRPAPAARRRHPDSSALRLRTPAR